MGWYCGTCFRQADLADSPSLVLLSEGVIAVAKNADAGTYLHNAGSHIIEALMCLAKAADAFDSENCRDLVYLADLAAQEARAGYDAGPPRALAFWIPKVAPHYELFHTPAALAQRRRLRASVEATLRQAIWRAWDSGALPKPIPPFGARSVLWIDYGYSVEGGPVDVTNVWAKAIASSLAVLGVVEDRRSIELIVTHSRVCPAEVYTTITLLDLGDGQDPFVLFRHARYRALNPRASSDQGSQ